MNRDINKELKSAARHHGSIVIFFVIMLPILLATMGLALDVGKFYVIKSELQNAADACALAAAYELDGTDSQITRATNAGLKLAGENMIFFQKEDLLDTKVEFSTTPNGSYVSAGPANANFVKCRVERPSVSYWFIPILQGLVPTPPDIKASAVANNVPGQTTCSLPIALCSSQVSASTPVGTWLEGVQDQQGGTNGYFKWVDFNPPAGGASELHDLLSGGNTCNINATNPNIPIAEYGLISSANVHYNTRFGVYAQGAKDGVPDLSGYAYNKTSFAAAFNAYPDFVKNKRPANLPYQGDDNTNLNTKPGLKTVLPSSELIKQGKNRRVSVAPIIDCTSKKFQRYACVFLLHPMNTGNVKKGDDDKMYLEYLGDANATGPCKSFELAGSANGTGPKVSSLVQ